MRQLIVLLFAGACAHQQTVPAGTQHELGTEHAVHSQAITPPNQDAQGRTTTSPPSADAKKLVETTTQLDDGTEPERISRALQALATAIDEIAPASAGDTQTVRNAAEDLARADRPVAALRAGLDAAIRAMGEAQPPTAADQERYRAATTDLRTAVSAIDPTRPLTEQNVVTRAAFRAAARAVFAAQDAAPPTFEDNASTARR